MCGGVLPLTHAQNKIVSGPSAGCSGVSRPVHLYSANFSLVDSLPDILNQKLTSSPHFGRLPPSGRGVKQQHILTRRANWRVTVLYNPLVK